MLLNTRSFSSSIRISSFWLLAVPPGAGRQWRDALKKRHLNQFFVCYRPSKHLFVVGLLLFESLSALVWEKTSVLAGDFIRRKLQLFTTSSQRVFENLVFNLTVPESTEKLT